MNELKETIYINRLLDLYGNLLTNSQRDIMYDYYDVNLSLSEISENRCISRTAVSDSLKKGREKLLYFEEKLGICRTFDSLKSNSDQSKNDFLAEIEEKLKNGI